MNTEWLRRQLLPPCRGATVVDVLRSGGWINTAGGTGPYVAFKARIPAFRRQAADRAAFVEFNAVEVPSVRDSMMLVPAEDAALALAAGRRAFAARVAKLDVDERETGVLVKRIDAVLAGGAVRSVDGLRHDIPSKLIRELGDAGKQLGFQTTLPLALRRLQVEGRIMRIGEERRLDGKRHVYRAWPKEVPLQAVPDDLDVALAERFLAWAAPATADEFAWWAGIGKRAAKTAMAACGSTVPEAPHRETTGAASQPLFLPFRDNYFQLHRSLLPFVDDPRGIELLDMQNKRAPLERLESLHHNAIVIDGELRGIWEYDPDAGKVVWRTFRKEHGVEPVAAILEAFIRDELGDHKFYALDHARARGPRITFVRDQ
jgi:hypothetical protein